MCLFISSVTPFSGFLSLRLRFHSRILHHVLKSQIVTVTATSFPFLVFLLSGLFFFEHHSPTRIVPGAVVGVEGGEREKRATATTIPGSPPELSPHPNTHTHASPHSCPTLSLHPSVVPTTHCNKGKSRFPPIGSVVLDAPYSRVVQGF